MPPPARFGAYRLDPADERLWRGSAAVPLGPKAFQVLRHLVERPGRLVTKEELLRAVWPGTAISDAALTRCIRELRQTLGDAARSPTFIATVHRRGFRFTAAVDGPEPVIRHASRPSRSRQEVCKRGQAASLRLTFFPFIATPSTNCFPA
jgi:DNA-binding winged helix-turn-helix (wHTH) protein